MLSRLDAWNLFLGVSCTSCTALHAIEIIKFLEDDLQKPVVTSNQATFWNMLRLAGVNDKIEGFGQLLEKH